VQRNLLQRVRQLITELTEDRDIAITLQTTGPMTAVGDKLAEHVETVMCEAISYAVRHSGATQLTISIAAADVFTLDIIDDGCGIPADNHRHSGLADIRHRAEQLGGTCRISSPPDGGNDVRWTAPLTST
jgi:signal transduction histidine kinase